MKSRIILTAVVLLSLAAAGSAQLSMAKADWARGPVQFLMTKEDVTAWNAVKSDADADRFIALFWARRDPTPGTPQNEFRDEYERRVEYADKTFTTARQRGSLTDRGKVLILFGAPARAARSGGTGLAPAVPGTSTSPVTDEDASVERQTWTYEGTPAQKMFNAPRAEFRFTDRMGTHDLRMETPRIDFAGAQQRMIAGVITQPNLTSVPQTQTATASPQPVPAAAAPVAAPMTTLKTATYETAVADAKNAKTPSKAMISYAEFVAPTGDYYAPVALFIPASAGMAPDAADTFFGVVEDAGGKRVLAFEEPAKLTPSKTDFFIDKTLNLPSGKYTVTFGLGKAGAPVTIASAPIELNALPKEATGTSRLILSNNVYETAEAAPVKSPFAFGKLKIVPKADLTFTNKDELNYFVEVHNPGLAEPATASAAAPATSTAPAPPPAAGLPKLQIKLDLLDSKGKAVAGSPLSDAQALPLSGKNGPGEYAIINGIPLSQMSKPLAPGEYTLKVKIVDLVTKQSYNLEQKFKITA